MAQTSYSERPDRGFAGQLDDLSPSHKVHGINGESAAIPFGIMMAEDDGAVKALPAAEGFEPAGIVLHTHAYSNRDLATDDGVDADEPMNLLRKGRVRVLNEVAVSQGDPVYARHTANGGDTQLGKFRNDNDGVAQVSTLTPTSANDTVFRVQVLMLDQLFTFSYTSDSASSATEICDGLRALMQADTVFNALIGSTGTATLILTAVAAQKGVPFYVAPLGVGVITVAATTAASTKAQLIPNARFVEDADADTLSVVEINLP